MKGESGAEVIKVRLSLFRASCCSCNMRLCCAIKLDNKINRRCDNVE